ncbi:MAG TPA: urate hydroxylase PuuD, partial [Longimicrobiales bacterium]|nr:urate hydroxylase PuuD [Longimicrobiales bacterium]
MAANLHELLDVIARWIHVIAGIMWIGNSMLWNWIDRNLAKGSKGDEAEGRSIGSIWLLHSGAFYHMEKTLWPGNPIPAPMHWFKWQSYITWMSGAALLVIVYYLSGAALLLGTNSAIDATTAIAISAASILLAWPIYNLLKFNAVTGLLALLAISFGYTCVFSGRAAFLHVGALLATIMAGNVFMVIMPSQRQLVAAVEKGEDTVPALAARAKARSIHNNYLTFPVLVLMLSSHFPGLYGHRYNWLLLGVLVLAGASVRHFMNIRFTQPRWK